MITAIPPVPQTMGVPRIVSGRAVTSLLGDPSISAGEERVMRRRIVETALSALAANVAVPSIFS